jgi:hypothetical protein
MKDSCLCLGCEVPVRLANNAGFDAPSSRVAMSGWQKRERADNVHTFHLGLPRTATGLARIPHVSGTSQCSQASESRSSPTSGTAYPLVRGGFCFNVCTFCLVRSL